MSTTRVDEEESEPGQGTKVHDHRDAEARRRIRAQARAVNGIGAEVDTLRVHLGRVEVVQTTHGVKIDTMIGFHAEIKSYFRTGIIGLFALLVSVLSFGALEIWKLAHVAQVISP